MFKLRMSSSTITHTQQKNNSLLNDHHVEATAHIVIFWGPKFKDHEKHESSRMTVHSYVWVFACFLHYKKH